MQFLTTFSWYHHQLITKEITSAPDSLFSVYSKQLHTCARWLCWSGSREHSALYHKVWCVLDKTMDDVSPSHLAGYTIWIQMRFSAIFFLANILQSTACFIWSWLILSLFSNYEGFGLSPTFYTIYPFLWIFAPCHYIFFMMDCVRFALLDFFLRVLLDIFLIHLNRKVLIEYIIFDRVVENWVATGHGSFYSVCMGLIT